MITVISVVYNRPEYTEVFLDSLYSTDHGEQIAPIIVNNGSRKRTSALLESWVERYDLLPEATKLCVAKPRLITFPENIGFAAGANAAMRTPMSSLACLMHNDTIPFPGWAAELKTVLELEEDAAVAMPRTNYANELGPCDPELREAFLALKPGNKDRVEPADILSLMDKVYPNGRAAIVDQKKDVLPRYSYSVDIASFCMMFRTQLLEKYGLFDEDFFPRMYEDKFWFLPLQRNGWIGVIANRAFVHHFGNITSDGPGFSFPEMAKANEERFKKKVAELDAKYFNRVVKPE